MDERTDCAAALGEDAAVNVSRNAQAPNDICGQAIGVGQVVTDLRCVRVDEAFGQIEQDINAGLACRWNSLPVFGHAEPQQPNQAHAQPAHAAPPTR